MALLEKILEDIKLLNRKEKDILLDVLKREKAKNVDAAKFEQAVGSWADFDADDFIADIYTRRCTEKKGCAGMAISANYLVETDWAVY